MSSRKYFDHPTVHILKKEARQIRSTYVEHMIDRRKAENGFVLSLVADYPYLGYKCVYKAARGAYDEME